MRGVLVSLVLSAVPIVEVTAQQSRTPSDHRWALGLIVGSSSFGRAAEATGDSGERFTAAPYRPFMTGLRLTRGGSGLRVAASAQYGSAGIAFRGTEAAGDNAVSGLLIVGEDIYDLWTFSAGASTRLVRLEGAASIRPSLGLELQRWSASGSPSLMILGGEAGLGLEVPLNRTFVAEFSGTVGFTPHSAFRTEDLTSAEFRPTSTWRRSVMAAVYWRF